MPELPEIYVIADQMSKTVKGRVVDNCFLMQEKCLNRPAVYYKNKLSGEKIEQVIPLGKWLEILFSSNIRLLVNLGMGGEICFLEKENNAPEKSRFIMKFKDGTGFYVSFWWFGYIHFVGQDEFHKMTVDLGPDPMEMEFSEFESHVRNSKGIIKNFLLNQKKIRGIGNYYAQEIFFRAGVHPLKKIENISDKELLNLYQSIKDVFKQSVRMNSSSYEKDFFGRKGLYMTESMGVGYKAGKPCPKCGTNIEKIKTGATSHYICPKCQKL